MAAKQSQTWPSVRMMMRNLDKKLNKKLTPAVALSALSPEVATPLSLRRRKD
jgi:hypothetical protein